MIRWMLVIALIVLPVRAAGQDTTDAPPVARIHGRVIEHGGRERSLAGVSVTLRPGNRQATTDANGRFEFRALAAGDYEVSIALEGHGGTTDSLTLGQGAAVDVLLRLSPRGGPVPAMEVAERNVALERVAFYDRRDREPGIFLTPQDLARRNPRRLTDVFREMPSVDIAQSTRGGTTILFRRGVACTPDVYLDNQRLGYVDVDLLRPEEMLAIEVYIGGSVPIRFRSSTCGVILLWSRRRA